MIPPEVLEELYGGDPDEFVADRKRLAADARGRGERDLAGAIAGLRKPSVAAWAMNLLVRRRPAELDRLLDLGERMRAAQSELDVDLLRTLRPERDTALDAVTRAARFVADAEGRTLSMAATDAIRSTAVAALADAAAADAVATGALVRTLDYAGFGEVDLADAVAARLAGDPAPDPDPDPDPGDEGTRSEGNDEARRRLRERLTEQLGEADRALAEASLIEAEAGRRLDKASTRTAELRRLLENAEQEEEARRAAVSDARATREDAASTHADLRRRLDLA